jgi:hypothetical protein
MRRSISRRVLLLAVGSLMAPLLALADEGWTDEAKIQVKVHDHVFHTVKTGPTGCVMRVRLQFDAPASAYAEPAPERNHYRFSIKVIFSDGKSIVSPTPIDNRQPGARAIAFKFDTTAEGCWTDGRPSLRKVDVHACRGPGCVPQPFQ